MRAALDEIVLEGARRMLAAALEAEVDAYVAAWQASSTSAAGAWWSATATPRRTITTAAGRIEVSAPR